MLVKEKGGLVSGENLWFHFITDCIANWQWCVVVYQVSADTNKEKINFVEPLGGWSVGVLFYESVLGELQYLLPWVDFTNTC